MNKDLFITLFDVILKIFQLMETELFINIFKKLVKKKQEFSWTHHWLITSPKSCITPEYMTTLR